MEIVVRGAFVSRLRLSSLSWILNRSEKHGVKRKRFFGGKAGKPCRVVREAGAIHHHLQLKVFCDAERFVESGQASVLAAATRHEGCHGFPRHACQDAVVLSTFAVELLRGDLRLTRLRSRPRSSDLLWRNNHVARQTNGALQCVVLEILFHDVLVWLARVGVVLKHHLGQMLEVVQVAVVTRHSSFGLLHRVSATSVEMKRHAMVESTILLLCGYAHRPLDQIITERAAHG